MIGILENVVAGAIASLIMTVFFVSQTDLHPSINKFLVMIFGAELIVFLVGVLAYAILAGPR